MRGDSRFWLVLLCFFFSGLAALIYQTAWTRQFAFVFGTSELAVATVLASYMGGLALGAAVAARLATRIRRPVLAYGLLELGIALSAVVAVPLGIRAARGLHHALLAAPGGPPPEGGAASAIFYVTCSFVIVLIPTALMGATLPLLARYAVRAEGEIGPRVGALYAINTVGAVFGTVAAGFFLLPALGLGRTVWVGAALNALVFVIAATLARAVSDDATAAPQPTRRADLGAAFWVLPAMAISGAVSFTYEVLWTRLLGHVLGGSVYAFATMLASFLTGIALGSWAASRWARTSEQATTAFAWVQIGAGLLSLAAFVAVDRVPEATRALIEQGGPRLLADALTAALTLLPGALCIGATFPLAVRVVAREAADAAPASARVYAWNTLGAIVGAIGAGFVVVPALGFDGTLVLAVAVNLALAILAATRGRGPGRATALVAAACLAALALVRPEPPWLLLRSSPLNPKPAGGELALYSVGRSATVMVLEKGSAWQLRTNGLPESTVLPKGARASQFATAHWMLSLPTLLRPDARSALVVGLGGGVLVEDVPRSIERIDVIELEPEVVEANRLLSGVRRRDPLADPRVRVIVNDARGALSLTDERYDVIASQPSHPWTAGSSHLYTREFFELARDHLNPGGLLVQWMGLSFVDADLLRGLVATVATVFPEVEVYQPAPSAVLFVASDRPFADRAAIGRVLAGDPERFAEIGLIGPRDLDVTRVLDAAGARTFAEGANVNTDDRNWLLMRSPAISRNRRKALEVDALFAPHDPLARAPLDPYVLRGLLGRRFAARAERLADAAQDPALLSLGRGLVALSRGRSGSGVQALLDALEAEPGWDEASMPLLRQWRRAVVADRPEPAAVVAGASPAVAAVVEGWRAAGAENWAAVRALEPRLAGIGPEHAAFAEATRLRAEWRIALGGTEGSLEAVVLLDVVLASQWDPEMLLLRARACGGAGETAAALDTLYELAQSDRLQGRRDHAQKALALLESLEPATRDPAGARARQGLVAWFQRPSR